MTSHEDHRTTGHAPSGDTPADATEPDPPHHAVICLREAAMALQLATVALRLAPRLNLRDYAALARIADRLPVTFAEFREALARNAREVRR